MTGDDSLNKFRRERGWTNNLKCHHAQLGTNVRTRAHTEELILFGVNNVQNESIIMEFRDCN